MIQPPQAHNIEVKYVTTEDGTYVCFQLFMV